MISRDGEISIAGGGEEMVRAISLWVFYCVLPFLFFISLFIFV